MASHWTFERTVAVINVVALAVGATLAAVDWYPKFAEDRYEASANLQTPTDPAGTFSIADVSTYSDGSHLYDVKYQVNAKNISRSPIEISYSISQLYLGDIPAIPLGVHEAYKLNDPPTPWDSAGSGAINWTLIAYDASIADDNPSAVRDWLAQCYVNISLGQGLTGSLAPGASTGNRTEFFVRADPDEYVSIVVAYGINGATKSPGPNLGLLWEVHQLGPFDHSNGRTSHAPRPRQSGPAARCPRSAVNSARGGS